MMMLEETNDKLGYNYAFNFSLNDDIIPRCRYTPSPGVQAFLFEIRSTLFAKTIEGDEERFGSETFNGCLKEADKINFYLEGFVSDRFIDEYLLPEEGYTRFVKAVESFARENAADGRDIIPILVEVEVCATQKPGEAVDALMERAIKKEHLVPQYLVSAEAGSEWCRSLEKKYDMGGMSGHFLVYLQGERRRDVSFGLEFHLIRVEDMDQGLSLMTECGSCRRRPKLGDQIACLRCGHSFHWHCAVNWLESNETCYTCGAKEHSFLGNLFYPSNAQLLQRPE